VIKAKQGALSVRHGFRTVSVCTITYYRKIIFEILKKKIKMFLRGLGKED